MDTISPAAEHAFQLLRTELYSQLDDADFLALKYEPWCLEDMLQARELIPNLVFVIRGLLIEHFVHGTDDCQICGSAWPCPVVNTIHAILKDPEPQFTALFDRTRKFQCAPPEVSIQSV